MLGLNVLLMLYAALNLGLGIYGFAVKQSMVSLIAGAAIAALILFTLWLTKTNPRMGRIGSLIVAVLVTGRFLPMFLKSGDWLPAGILSIASGVVIIALLAGHMMAMQAKKVATPSGE